jgi:hypothetical protein
MIPMLASLSWTGVGLRAGVIAGALVVWFWTQSLIARKAAAKDGIGDVVHDLTTPWHQYLSRNERAANGALIVSSICIDLVGLALIGSAIFGPTFAPFLAILIVFALRQVCQSLCTLPPPPGIIWRSPGFPALLVTYDVGNDFFFSGQTWLAVLAAVIALGEMLIVLVLRAHYTLDVVAGAFAAFFAAAVAGRLSPLVDAWLR